MNTFPLKIVAILGQCKIRFLMLLLLKHDENNSHILFFLLVFGVCIECFMNIITCCVPYTLHYFIYIWMLQYLIAIIYDYFEIKLNKSVEQYYICIMAPNEPNKVQHVRKMCDAFGMQFCASSRHNNKHNDIVISYTISELISMKYALLGSFGRTPKSQSISHRICGVVFQFILVKFSWLQLKLWHFFEIRKKMKHPHILPNSTYINKLWPLWVSMHHTLCYILFLDLCVCLFFHFSAIHFLLKIQYYTKSNVKLNQTKKKCLLAWNSIYHYSLLVITRAQYQKRCANENGSFMETVQFRSNSS